MRLLELSSGVKQISSKLSEDDLLRALKTEAKNSYDAARRRPIFTKVETKEPFFVADPSKVKRSSKFIVDGLTTLLSSWRGWADRLHSVRGWTSRELADSRNTGELCLLIPTDKARVHVCDASSFYRSFKKAHAAFETEKIDNDALCTWLKSLYKVARTVNDKLPKYEEPESAAQFMQALKALDSSRKAVMATRGEDLPNIEREDARRAWAAFGDDLQSTINKLLDPDDNGFSTHTSLYNLPDDREVWTGGKCIIITLDEYESLVKRSSLK